MSAPISDSNYVWANIDQVTDKQRYVQNLASIAALDAVRAYKRQSFAMMDIRVGDHLLDVGCGPGEDVVALAQMGASRVVGVDSSETMIDAARQRAEGLGLPVEFRVADGQALPFPDHSFDGCRSERMFQHLSEPEVALAEMMRVTRPDRWVVVADVDWDTVIIDSPNRAVTRAVIHAKCDSVRQGWIGRHLWAMFNTAGLREVAVTPDTVTLTSLELANGFWKLQAAVDELVAEGVVSTSDAAAWWQDLEEADAAGRFFCAITAFIAAGRTPDGPER